MSNWRSILVLFFFPMIFLGCSGIFANFEKVPFLSRLQTETVPVYHNFCDVLIPGQLKIDNRKSCIFCTSEFSVGVLSLKGRIIISDLIDFFEKNMSDDNWIMVNSFKSSRSIMLFKKGSRWCAICATEVGSFTTVEIWVLPNVARLS